MKRIKLSAAMTAILFGLSLNTASAKSWRVNHDTTTGANFASINDAMSAKDAQEKYESDFAAPCSAKSIRVEKHLHKNLHRIIKRQ